MNVEEFITSGILENYCIGFTTEFEKAEVESAAARYPEVKQEIQRLRTVFEKYIIANKVAPSPKVKYAVMQAVYKQQAGTNQQFPPLITDGQSTHDLAQWLKNHPAPSPTGSFENIFIHELPSTDFLTNFIVWAKDGHETEIHTDCNEFLYVIKGSCTMYFENEAKHYEAGDLITIPPHLNHKAVVTSDFPMMAFVQRQACA